MSGSERRPSADFAGLFVTHFSLVNLGLCAGLFLRIGGDGVRAPEGCGGLGTNVMGTLAGLFQKDMGIEHRSQKQGHGKFEIE